MAAASGSRLGAGSGRGGNGGGNGGRRMGTINGVRDRMFPLFVGLILAECAPCRGGQCG